LNPTSNVDELYIKQRGRKEEMGKEEIILYSASFPPAALLLRG